jgi:hypothetical protein
VDREEQGKALRLEVFPGQRGEDRTHFGRQFIRNDSTLLDDLLNESDLDKPPLVHITIQRPRTFGRMPIQAVFRKRVFIPIYPRHCIYEDVDASKHGTNGQEGKLRSKTTARMPCRSDDK